MSFHSIGHPVRQFASDLAFGPWIQGPFSLQTDLPDARSLITSESINGAEPVTVVVSAVSWVNIVAKLNKFPFPTIPVWDQKQVKLLNNPWKTIWLVDESDVRGRSDSFCLWKINGRTSKRASEADRAQPFHFISGGSGVRLQRPFQSGPDARWSEKLPLVMIFR